MIAGQLSTATGRVVAHERFTAVLAEAVRRPRPQASRPEEEKTTLGPVHLAVRRTGKSVLGVAEQLHVGRLCVNDASPY
jgi:acyl-CoA reductase-like NAD-dependent aldehyde dehydrogenase